MSRRRFSGMQQGERGIEPRGALTLHAVTAHKRVACLNRFNRALRSLCRVADQLTAAQYAAVTRYHADVSERVRFGAALTYTDAVAIDAHVTSMNYMLLGVRS
jgi:hypothetical protein